MAKQIWKIAICDDELYDLNHMKIDCIELMEKIGENYQLICFQDGKDLLESTKHFHFVFLDIEMNGKTGFEIAERLKKKNPSVLIIFITSHQEWVQEAFKVQAFRYLYKENGKGEFQEALLDALEECRKDRMLLLKGQENKRYVKIGDIDFIESLGEEIAVYLADEHITCKNTLKCAKEQLDDGFFQSHRNFLVNLRKVESYSKTSISLRGGKKVPLSRRKAKEFDEYFYRYLLIHSRYL